MMKTAVLSVLALFVALSMVTTTNAFAPQLSTTRAALLQRKQQHSTIPLNMGFFEQEKTSLTREDEPEEFFQT